MSNAHHFRKTVAGACMVLAPLLFLASAVVTPKLDADGSDQLALLSGHEDRWFTSQALAMVGLVLFVPAVLGLMHMLREREVAAGHLGGALALVGTLAAAAAVGLGFALWQMAAGGADAAQMGALADRLTDTTGIVALVFVPTLLIAVGMVVLAYGLWRARAVHPLMAACVAVGAVVLDLGLGMLASAPMAIVGAAVLVVGLGTIGWHVLRESDADWEHTPTWTPAAGMR